MEKGKYGMYAAAGAWVAALAAQVAGEVSAAKALVLAGTCLLGVAFRLHATLRRFVFTVVIAGAVLWAFFFPALFVGVGGHSFRSWIVPLLQVIMFGMGTTLSGKDFAGVFRMPAAVGVGVLSQLAVMPLMAWLMARATGLPAELAAGVILVGCCPSGVASNVVSYLAKANVALSVTLTAVITLLAPFTTPLLMKWLAGQLVPIDTLDMMGGIVRMVILPVMGGLLVNTVSRGKAKWLHRVMPPVSMAGIAFILAIITAAGRDQLLHLGWLLVLAAVVHNLSGYAFGYGLSRWLGLSERDCRTVAIEVGMQNSGLASGIALEMGRLATLGLPAAVFGPWMNVSGSLLASWWRSRPSGAG
jgi:BASS family bile acid:Na+ symporter